VISSFSDYKQTCRGYRIKRRDTSIELTIHVTTQRKYQLNGKMIQKYSHHNQISY
jgi:hypothetical protein